MANSQATMRKGAAPKPVAEERQVVHNPWVKALERFGYVARGVLFLVIGFLALLAATNKPGGNLTDPSGAMATLAAQPFGHILLIIMVIGLIGFAIWGLVRAIFDPLGRGTDTQGLLARFGYLVSAVSYTAVAIPFAQLALGTGGAPVKSQTQTTQDMTAQLLSNPFGAIVVAALGAALIVWSLAQLYNAFSGKFEKDLKTREMPADAKKTFVLAGKVGISARALIFALMGVFLIQSAVNVDPKQAVGLDGALWKLTQQPQGPALLGAAAVGLMFFGVYSIICARWVDID